LCSSRAKEPALQNRGYEHWGGAVISIVATCTSPERLNRQNDGMRSVRALFRRDLTGPLIRYGIAGGCVGLVYLTLPLLLGDVVGLPIDAAIAIAYAIALTLHFNLQRHFVFARVDQFALTTFKQIGRYAMIVAIQYPTTALAIAFLPRLLGVSSDAVFLIVTLAISLMAFLILRRHVFRPIVEDEPVRDAPIEDDRLAARPRAPLERLGRCGDSSLPMGDGN
jgi:putative flippase GtrA